MFNTKVYYLTDGTKDITFIGMCHIGSDRFYNLVRDMIKTEKSKGKDYLYEGIAKPDGMSDEDADIVRLTMMKKLTGITDVSLKEFYSYAAKLMNLSMQANDSFLKFPGGKDINADMNLNEINDRLGDGQKETMTIKKELEYTVRKFSRFSFFIRSAAGLFLRFSPIVRSTFSAEITVDKRNKILLDELINSNNSCVITYGLAHFDGFFQLLKQYNDKWTITKVEKLKVW